MQLTDPVTQIPLVGPKYQRLLEKLGIRTIEDLLHHYPSQYKNYTRKKKINQLVAGETVTVTATVLEIKNIYTRYGKRLTRATVADETGQLEVVWFNQPYLTRNIKKNNLVNLSGTLGIFNHKPAFVSPEYEVLAPQEEKSNTLTEQERYSQKSPRSIHTGRLVPIYPETRGITSKWLRSRINHLLKSLAALETDLEFLPESTRKSQKLINLNEALSEIHFPKSQENAQEARRRLAFDELFLMQLQALKRRQKWQRRRTTHRFNNLTRQQLNDFINSLPFRLTNAQLRAINEILSDLTKNTPMNRLLEGDVGSGKTVVAAAAIYAAHLNGRQSALMAPTEVLAEQHYQEIKKMLEPFGASVVLKTGSQQAKIGNQLSIIVGTHALLFDTAEFPKLGLVIVDEQHRFGVRQRAQLLKKSGDQRTPHLLTMSATPIPRSLALTIYGDLDLSVLDEMPPGRKVVKTWVVPNHKRPAAYSWVGKQIIEGKKSRRAQAFIIYPLIEESDHETMQSVKAATAEFQKLSAEIFPDLKLALLHGRINSKEKNQILIDFAAGKYDILVATQVVEVGIDIPNATIIMIEGADRFGLASLHQLRGRVGRSDRESYCLLFSESRSGKVYRRLKAMETINDGFRLAEIDLKLRGPGEIYGTRQHGIAELKIANLSDVKLIEAGREEAKKLLSQDTELSKYPRLKEKLERMSSDLVEPN